jgi:ketosteroid isomerase-like protein
MIASAAITWDGPQEDHPARRAARSSMTAVAKGERDSWFALFSPDALIEDPVGPSLLDPEGKGHRGREGLAAFWDSFVAMPSEFHFHVKDSFANGPSCANVATITTTFSDGSSMTIDCIVVYTVDDSGLITSMRAHWEPDRAMATLTKP